ncbi:hypothetical protein F4825DRAFT_469019 [Nemania diffusa]|nr:hypothetical protein F4825DRAFT_469019 [Nemania diffusa]
MEPQNTEEDIWAAHVLMRLASGGLHHAPPRPVPPVLPAGHAAEEADDAAAEQQLQQEQQQQLQEQLHQDQGQQQQQQQEQGQEQEQEQQAIFAAHLRDSIQIPELWAVEEEDWPAEALALARLPPQRSVQRLGKKPFLANPKEWNMTAAVGQCVGEEAAEPCSRCRRGGRGGRFTGGCIVLPAGVELKKKPLCCLNCRYQWQYNQCSFIQNQQQ